MNGMVIRLMIMSLFLAADHTNIVSAKSRYPEPELPENALVYDHLEERNKDLYCEFGTVKEIENGAFERLCFQRNKGMTLIGRDGKKRHPYLKHGAGVSLYCPVFQGVNVTGCSRIRPNQKCKPSCDSGCQQEADLVECMLVGPWDNVSAQWSNKTPCVPCVINKENPENQAGNFIMSTTSSDLHKETDNMIEIVLPLVCSIAFVSIIFLVIIYLKKKMKESIDGINQSTKSCFYFNLLRRDKVLPAEEGPPQDFEKLLAVNCPENGTPPTSVAPLACGTAQGPLEAFPELPQEKLHAGIHGHNTDNMDGNDPLPKKVEEKYFPGYSTFSINNVGLASSDNLNELVSTDSESANHMQEHDSIAPSADTVSSVLLGAPPIELKPEDCTETVHKLFGQQIEFFQRLHNHVEELEGRNNQWTLKRYIQDHANDLGFHSPEHVQLQYKKIYHTNDELIATSHFFLKRLGEYGVKIGSLMHYFHDVGNYEAVRVLQEVHGDCAFCRQFQGPLR